MRLPIKGRGLRIACRGQIDHTDKADWRVCALLEFSLLEFFRLEFSLLEFTVRLPTFASIPQHYPAFAAFCAFTAAVCVRRASSAPNDAAIGPRVILLSTQKGLLESLLGSLLEEAVAQFVGFFCLRFIENRQETLRNRSRKKWLQRL